MGSVRKGHPRVQGGDKVHRLAPLLLLSPLWNRGVHGYRHILIRHRADFERLAAGTYQNWRDIADLAMDSITRDPDAAKLAGGNQSCLSRVIFLRNLRTNQVVRQQIIRMYVRNGDNNIATVYPAGTQCP